MSVLSNPRLIAVVILSFAFGWAIWALSPAIVGKSEPWDANNFYFPAALFFSGVLIGLIAPRYFWIVPIGMFLGQLGFMAFNLPSGPLVAFGVVFLAIYTLLALAGASLSFVVRKKLS